MMIIATAGTAMTSAIHQAPRILRKRLGSWTAQIAREDASGQPRKRQIKQNDQGQGTPEDRQALAIEPVVDAVDPFAEQPL